MSPKPYLQLIRLPNVFTAAADSLAGWLLVEGSLHSPGRWVPLVFASVATYAGGIVLNDVFDLEVDRVERPGRPLPSGKVPLRTALILGWSLLAAGILLALVSRTRYGLIVQMTLICCVVAYDAGLKRTRLGPQVMGLCRGLNVLLGMSHAPQFGGEPAWIIAFSYGLFVAGITWISRSEVGEGSRRNVLIGIVLQDLALCGLLWVCLFGFGINAFWPFVGLVVLLTVANLLNRRTIAAYRSPSPEFVQLAVKMGIFLLVWLHVGVLLAARGPFQAVAVASLWFPTVYSGRWIYST